MAQSYFTRVSSPVKESFDSPFSSMHVERQLKVEDIQEAYVEQKDRLINAIDSTKEMLNDFRTFNKNEWVVRYPQFHELPAEETEHDASSSSSSVTSTPPFRRKAPRRSLSFVDDPSFEAEVVMSKRHGLHRAITLASIQDLQEEEEAQTGAEKENQSDGEHLFPPSDFNVLKLDLKLGAHTSSATKSLVHHLEQASIANLLDERFAASMSHMDKLRLRVQDTSSKVLVTGDLNAGKSTFVNALLRREVMPVDQQPCTTAFCEVHDAAENLGVEEVHVLKEGVEYNVMDDSTFTRGTLTDLEEIVADNETAQPMIKVYLADTRAPSESLLNNGVVDISLIDAPGLNRDSIKTTAVFARQEEIDVVVFVVSAENHFTLSAKEFLMNASHEKAYLFIVVNKYDQIKNKEKCRKLVLDQIKNLSPRTYEDANDLVHFVDSAAALQPYTANPSFDDLESALRSFVLVKRSKSKLLPVTTFLSNLLSEIELLASSNVIMAATQIQQAEDDLALSRPVLDKMKNSRDALETELDETEDDGVANASNRTRAILSAALERVGQGKPAIDKLTFPMPTYPGFLGIWDYAKDVRRALLASIDAAVKMAEDEARVITSAGVDRINALVDMHLPEGAERERSRKVFVPEAMFSQYRRVGKGIKRRSTQGGHAVVAGGLAGLGIGLAQRHDLLETTLFDLFDVNHQFLVYFGDGKDVWFEGEEEGPSPSALSIMSVGLGALTMVGGQTIGARGILEGIVRISDLVANEAARKWAAPVVGAVVIGFGAYLVMELPNSVPRTVGRRVRAQVARMEIEHGAGRRKSSDVVTNVGGRSAGFVEGHAGRVGKETRKVLRFAAWDLKDKFRAALEERAKEVKSSEEMEKKAMRAKEWFEVVQNKTVEIRENVALEGIST